jgi:DNA-directed RNA polymerase subunit M/transcription elongation factor TFIIS
MKTKAARMKKGDLKCADCGGMCKPARIRAGRTEVRGWKCQKCGYEIISPEDVERAYFMLKARRAEEVVISKRGNSFMVTIPIAITRALGINGSTLAEVLLEENGSIALRIKAGEEG